MLTYEKISNWLKEKENKDKLAIGACFILTFVIGFGAGNYEKEMRRDSYKPQTNYTTQTVKKTAAPATANNEAGVVAGTQTKAVATTTTTTQAVNCVVKGNISTGGRKIYHVQGGAFYKTVKPEQCFNTETEALAAGFVKSGR